MLKNNICYMLFLACLAFLLNGCQAYERRIADEEPYVFPVETLAVFGFLPSPAPAEEENAVRSPLTGSVFIRGPVPSEIPEQFTASLYELLSRDLSAEIIPPDTTRQVFLALEDPAYKADEREILRKTGESLLADALLAGYVFRWQERIGTDFSVSRPASVAFELALIRVGDGNLIWKGRFDKTQASLAEDLLGLRTFLRGKGRWMNVEDLAEMGLSELVEQIPIGKRE